MKKKNPKSVLSQKELDLVLRAFDVAMPTRIFRLVERSLGIDEGDWHPVLYKIREKYLGKPKY